MRTLDRHWCGYKAMVEIELTGSGIEPERLRFVSIEATERELTQGELRVSSNGWELTYSNNVLRSRAGKHALDHLVHAAH